MYSSIIQSISNLVGGFGFASPEYFLLLFVLPLMVYHYISRGRRKVGSIRFSSLDTLKNIRPSGWQKGFYFLLLLRLGAIFFLIIALARPQFSRTYEDILTQGIDIVLAVDVSASMYARDLEPDRIQVAKEVVKEFIAGRKNDRLGLVVFAGIAYSICPPTLDYNILQELMDKKVEVGVAEDGTAIGMGIVSSLNRLKDSDAMSRIIILLTDGENNRGKVDPLTAARMAEALGIKIYTIGVGKEGGAPIPIGQGLFGQVQYARNPDGSLLLTYLDEENLKEIASSTGGLYFRATDEDKLREIYRQIGEMETTEFKSRQYTTYREYFVPFAIMAFFLILLEIALSNTRFMRIP